MDLWCGGECQEVWLCTEINRKQKHMKIGPQDILLTLCIYRGFAVGSSRAVWAVPQSHSHSAVVFWCGSTVSLSSAHEDVPNMTRILHSRYRFGCVDTGESGKRRANPVPRREGAAKFASVRSDIRRYSPTYWAERPNSVRAAAED